MEQCIRLENDIQKSFVNKYITVGVFIDFQKAFDMLWKHGLLQYIYLNKCYLFLLVMFYCLKNHLHMIAYYHIYLEIPFFAVNHVSITYQMLFESL
jgi:hypothetical protein